MTPVIRILNQGCIPLLTPDQAVLFPRADISYASHGRGISKEQNVTSECGLSDSPTIGEGRLQREGYLSRDYFHTRPLMPGAIERARSHTLFPSWKSRPLLPSDFTGLRSISKAMGLSSPAHSFQQQYIILACSGDIFNISAFPDRHVMFFDRREGKAVPLKQTIQYVEGLKFTQKAYCF